MDMASMTTNSATSFSKQMYLYQAFVEYMLEKRRTINRSSLFLKDISSHQLNKGHMTSPRVQL